MTYEQVLGLSAAALNDQERQLYSNEILLPYFNMALIELQELFQQYSIPATEESSYFINVPLGTTAIGFNTSPTLPINFVDIIDVYESDEGQDAYSLMIRRGNLPPKGGTEMTSFGVWSWKDQQIQTYGLINDRDIKIDYIKTLFPFLAMADLTDPLEVVNAASFLFNRTAGLAAADIGENTSRADRANNAAALALDRSLGIAVKSEQSITYRRRPFRASFRRR